MILVIAKVFEGIVYNQLYAYLEEHNIISKYQSKKKNKRIEY